MKIVFMGTPSYATVILRKILQMKEWNVVGVFTQPDKPVGRKKTLTPPHIKEFLLKSNVNIPIYQPHTLKDEKILMSLKKLSPDVIIVAAYGQILTQEVLALAPCINLHASLLPRYRGASPIQSSILHNDVFSGVTAMLMDKGLDTGDMLGFTYVQINEKTTSETLFEVLSHEAARLTIKILHKLNTLNPLGQSSAISTYAPKIKKQDGLVDVTFMDAKAIWSKFRAFSPWPGIFLPNRLKLIKIEILDSTKKPNTITHIDENGFVLTCKRGSLHVKEVQPPSKIKMSAHSYIIGQRKKVGDNLY